MIQIVLIVMSVGMVSCMEEQNKVAEQNVTTSQNITTSQNVTTSQNETIITTTKAWKRKKPAYWEFPDTTTSERPDISAEYCKSTNMGELSENITKILEKPVRGQAEVLLTSVVNYVLTLHRFIRKFNTTDDIALRMARDLIQNKRPTFLDMEVNMPFVNSRVGFDKYEFQHFQLVWEDIQQSWEKLKDLLFGENN